MEPHDCHAYDLPSLSVLRKFRDLGVYILPAITHLHICLIHKTLECVKEGKEETTIWGFEADGPASCPPFLGYPCSLHVTTLF